MCMCEDYLMSVFSIILVLQKGFEPLSLFGAELTAGRIQSNIKILLSARSHDLEVVGGSMPVVTIILPLVKIQIVITDHREEI